MKNILIGIVLCLGIILACIVSNASAVSLGTFKAGQPIELVQLCDNGATLCSGCNISYVNYPNSTIFLSNVNMTKRTSDFSYIMNPSYVLGTYNVGGNCYDATMVKTWTYDFTITPSEGAENNTLTFIILASLAIILLLISFIFSNLIFAFLSGLSFSGAGVYAMIYGFGNITNLYTQIAALIIIGLGLIITIVSALEFLDEMSGGQFEGGYSTSEEEDND
jgi:hypothetical protein